MSTPVGHLLAGAAIGAALGGEHRTWRVTAWCALAGAAADLDFIPGLLIGEPARFHHAQSHSLPFVLLAAAVAAFLARKGRWRWALIVGLCYASHLALDYVTYDGSAPYGIPILWPLTSKAFLSPITLLPHVQHTSASVFSFHNFMLMCLEVGVLGPLLAWSWLAARKPHNLL